MTGQALCGQQQVKLIPSDAEAASSLICSSKKRAGPLSREGECGATDLSRILRAHPFTERAWCLVLARAGTQGLGVLRSTTSHTPSPAAPDAPDEACSALKRPRHDDGEPTCVPRSDLEDQENQQVCISMARVMRVD